MTSHFKKNNVSFFCFCFLAHFRMKMKKSLFSWHQNPENNAKNVMHILRKKKMDFQSSREMFFFWQRLLSKNVLTMAIRRLVKVLEKTFFLRTTNPGIWGYFFCLNSWNILSKISRWNRWTNWSSCSATAAASGSPGSDIWSGAPKISWNRWNSSNAAVSSVSSSTVFFGSFWNEKEEKLVFITSDSWKCQFRS